MREHQDAWTNATVCQHCEMEVEYVDSDEMEREDCDYEGSPFRYSVIVCPECGEETRVS